MDIAGMKTKVSGNWSIREEPKTDKLLKVARSTMILSRHMELQTGEVPDLYSKVTLLILYIAAARRRNST